jgi:hypothetical protein
MNGGHFLTLSMQNNRSLHQTGRCRPCFPTVALSWKAPKTLDSEDGRNTPHYGHLVTASGSYSYSLCSGGIYCSMAHPTTFRHFWNITITDVNKSIFWREISPHSQFHTLTSNHPKAHKPKYNPRIIKKWFYHKDAWPKVAKYFLQRGLFRIKTQTHTAHPKMASVCKSKREFIWAIGERALPKGR